MGGQVFGFEHGGSRRYAELVNRIFAMESTDAPLPPGFILEIDRPEWRFLKRELMWSTGELTIGAGGAGLLSRIQIQNPQGTNRIVVVTGARVINKTTAGRVNLTVDSAQVVAGISANVALDLRVAFGSGVTRKVASTNALDATLPGISGVMVDSQNLAAGADGLFSLLADPDRLGIVMPPNRFVDMVNRTPNEALTGVLWGYERPATPDELAP